MQKSKTKLGEVAAVETDLWDVYPVYPVYDESGLGSVLTGKDEGSVEVNFWFLVHHRSIHIFT